MKEKVKKLVEMYPIVMEYEALKKEIQKEAIEKNERYKDDLVTISLSNRSTYKSKYEVEEMEKINPLAVKKEIDIKFLKTLSNAEDYLEVTQTPSASVRINLP